MTLHERVNALEAQLHDTEYRLRMDLLQRDSAWRERITAAMSLLCRMLAAVIPDSLPRRHRDDAVSLASEQRPVPDLKPRAITLDEYHAHTPEKFELLEGYLFRPGDDPDARRRLLGLLLVNVGLLEAVTLAPEERWRDALRRVYGSAGA
jgi:hypothetical protein